MAYVAHDMITDLQINQKFEETIHNLMKQEGISSHLYSYIIIYYSFRYSCYPCSIVIIDEKIKINEHEQWID